MKEELFEEESADMDDNFDNDNFGDEDDKVNPLVAAGIFFGLIVLAAIICGILWSFTHKDKKEEQPVTGTETVQEERVETELFGEETAGIEASENEMVDNEATVSET